MRYLLKAQYIPDSKFKDDAFSVAGRTYSYESLADVELISKPTDEERGEIRLKLTNGTINWVVFTKADEADGMAVYEGLKERVNPEAVVMDPGKDAFAETIYNYSVMHGLGSDISRTWGIRHFLTALRGMLPYEKVLLPFMAQYNYEPDMMSDGEIAFIATDKRVIMAQKRMAGIFFQAVNWEGIDNVFVMPSMMAGIIEIENADRPVYIKIEKNTAQRITDYLNHIKELVGNNDTKAIDDLAAKYMA